ncbi:MAG: hypothetical protein RR075_07535 [Pygmaiobacter sp.]
MTRLTKKLPDGSFTAPDTTAALAKLALFETLCEDLVQSQLDTATALEELRHDNKTLSVKFKELLVKKLNNAHVLALVSSYGIDQFTATTPGGATSDSAS